METPLKPTCIYCDLGEDQVPLVQIRYRGDTYWICPQHLPVLIHQPAQLAHKLPGLENLGPAEQ